MDMFDRSPSNVVERLISEWLTLPAIVRLDSALCIIRFRPDWLMALTSGTYICPLLAMNKSALVAIRWTNKRQMSFAKCVLEITARNCTTRFRHLALFSRSLKQLTVIMREESKVVVERSAPPPSFLRSLFSQPLPGATNNTGTHIRNVLELEDDGEPTPVLDLPRLTSLTVLGQGHKTLEWLPIAPELTQLNIPHSQECMNDETIMRIADQYPKLTHLTLNMYYRPVCTVMIPGMYHLARRLHHLVVVDLMKCKCISAPGVETLIFHNPGILYLSLDHAALTDQSATAIAERLGSQLLGLDLGEGHSISQVGFNALAQHCSRLVSFRLAVGQEEFTPAQGEKICALITSNANTLQDVSILDTYDCPVQHNKEVDFTSALCRCVHLRTLVMRLGTDTNMTGLVAVLQQCRALQRLWLPGRNDYVGFEWRALVQALLAVHYPNVVLEPQFGTFVTPIWRDRLCHMDDSAKGELQRWSPENSRASYAYK